MNNRNKIIVSIVGIIMVLLSLLGLTFGYYITRIYGNTNTNTKSISISTSKLELVYNDESSEILSGSNVLIPSNDLSSDGAIGTKTFTVSNNGNDSSYVVVIDNVSVTNVSDGSSTSFASNDFRYTLSCTNSSGVKCNSVNDLTVFPINGGLLVGNSIAEGEVHTYILTLWYIDTGIDQSDDMGKSYQARVNIKDMTAVNPYKTGVSANDNMNFAYNIINNARLSKNGTSLVNSPKTSVAEMTSSSFYGKAETNIYPLINSNITNTNIYTYSSDYTIDSSGNFTLVDPKTLVYNESYEDLKGKYIVSVSGDTAEEDSSDIQKIYRVSPTEVSSTSFSYTSINKFVSNEKVLSITTDDYGISYYFRGGVEDNYVNFADMCWRIVRIVGDGSIKLILEDQDSTCQTANGNWNIPLTSGGTTTTGNYGYSQYASGGLIASDGKTSNIYTRFVMDYLHANINKDKSMATAFKNFQDTFTKNELSKLKSGDWCIANKGYSQSAVSGLYKYTLLNDAQILDNKVAGKIFYYNSYTRLMSENLNGYQPSLNCNGAIMETFEDDNNTPMYVGAITADEVAYAGGMYNSNNYSYYLLSDYQRENSLFFWTLSPFKFDGTYDYAFYVDVAGDLNYDYCLHNYDSSFRPTVSLASNIVISGGEGTIENPYVIG